MSPRPSNLKVLSVVGAGRSGTTVLASILGEVSGFASAGELRFLWERGILLGRPCGCGEIPARCEVWAPVIDKTMAALQESNPGATVADIVAAQRELARRRHLVRVLRSTGADTEGWPPLDLVRSATAAACCSLAEVTDAAVVVDTSKRPVDAAIMSGLPQVDQYVLHVVRDPHAVVHSWRRAKTYTTNGETRAIGTRTLGATVRRWTSNCLSAEVLKSRMPASRWLHVRYEDFAACPRATVEQILSFLGVGAVAPFTDDRTVRLRPNHIVAGNPSRFTTGLVEIREDDEWRRTMSARDKASVDLMTLPLIRRYGYGLAFSGSTDR
ncbi:MAG TPA: sulfotransferase [Nocardioidaceae bacterium]